MRFPNKTLNWIRIENRSADCCEVGVSGGEYGHGKGVGGKEPKHARACKLNRHIGTVNFSWHEKTRVPEFGSCWIFFGALCGPGGMLKQIRNDFP